MPGKPLKKRKAARTKAKAPRAPRSYTPISDALEKPFCFADTELAEGISRHGAVGLLVQALSRKRRRDGEPIDNLLCALLVWPLLTVKSIHCFCCELSQILKGKANVLYDFLGREDVSWRAFMAQMGRQVFLQNDLGHATQLAFVADDTIQERAGRKIEGTSSHFDHTQGRTVHGHQTLQLGLAGPRGFLPLEAQIVMSEVKPIDKHKDKPFKDQRSSAARDMRRSWAESRPALFRSMIKRAIEFGYRATFLLADAWFGCKENIALALQLNLTAIFQMKRGNLRYLYQGQHYTATALYAKVQRRMRPATAKARFKTASLIVSLDLETRPNQPPKWQEVRLVFSAPAKECKRDTWVLFLCTDTALSDSEILKAYSLRWSIEVYFKEIKQHLGFFKEQSGRYQVAYASVNLAAIRYLLLFDAMLRNGTLSYGAIRDRQTGQLQVLTYALLLWELFRALIEGALDGLVRQFGRKTIKLILAAINDTVEEFLSEAFQMQPHQVAAQLKAQKLGYL
jgi:hypothetical protein